MLFYWVLIVALLISIAAVLALWSMREYESAASGKTASPRPGRETKAEEKDEREIRGTIVLPKQHKVVK